MDLVIVIRSEVSHTEKEKYCLRPYHPERARSRLISEAKQGRAWLVLEWEKEKYCRISLPCGI